MQSAERIDHDVSRDGVVVVNVSWTSLAATRWWVELASPINRSFMRAILQ
jgi:hypothetical protein